MSNGGMSAVAIVVHLDTFKDTGPSLRPRAIAFAMNEFDLEAVEETFHSGIVITTPRATHAANQLVAPEQPLVAS